jgi:hypothetical protein
VIALMLDCEEKWRCWCQGCYRSRLLNSVLFYFFKKVYEVIEVSSWTSIRGFHFIFIVNEDVKNPHADPTEGNFMRRSKKLLLCVFHLWNAFTQPFFLFPLNCLGKISHKFCTSENWKKIFENWFCPLSMLWNV